MNRFYGEFDFATVKPRRRAPTDYRSDFQTDRDRIIHTGAFRSLQSKTQVFLSGEYDFYRTRLTHSIEVAQIGRSICFWLNHSSQQLLDDFFIDPDLVEATCLAHDIGHPPFGHCGERTLNQLMRDYGGFEGNAQTLRLLTDTIFTNPSRGLAPTRGLIDGVLKYKTLRCEWENPERHFVYDDQVDSIRFAMGGHDFPAELSPGKPRNGFKSIECQIMDWADDTAYSLHDVADGIHAGFLHIERIERWAADQKDHAEIAPIVEQLLQNIRDQRIEGRTGRKVGEFIQACELSEVLGGFLADETSRHRFGVAIRPEVLAECKIYKRISLDLVFKSQQLQQLDRKAHQILTKLFEAFAEFYVQPEGKRSDHMNLLSPVEEAEIWSAEDEAARARLVCDVIARMTDGFATRTYKRLFDADFGSIVDLV
ncbi:MAG: dGTPase [Verrucomicrobiales bacterium]|jgi:dGTPase